MYTENEDQIGMEEYPDIPVGKEPTIGVVVDCHRLNVRSRPSSGSEIICELKVGTSVMIDESESTDGFYKICTVSGIEGFCSKDYIAIHK